MRRGDKRRGLVAVAGAQVGGLTNNATGTPASAPRVPRTEVIFHHIVSLGPARHNQSVELRFGLRKGPHAALGTAARFVRQHHVGHHQHLHATCYLWYNGTRIDFYLYSRAVGSDLDTQELDEVGRKQQCAANLPGLLCRTCVARVDPSSRVSIRVLCLYGSSKKK